jgi:hypothetical protein
MSQGTDYAAIAFLFTSLQRAPFLTDGAFCIYTTLVSNRISTPAAHNPKAAAIASPEACPLNLSA